MTGHSPTRYFEAPDYYEPRPGDPTAVFLAGGITGVERWHTYATERLAACGEPVVILNPNRENFPIHDPDAGEEQVRWEQHHLHLPGTLTLFWFPASDPKVTTQPIAMFELGQAMGEGRRMVVGADSGYPRQADVRMMCQINQPGLTVHATLDATLDATLAAVVALVRRVPPVALADWLYGACGFAGHPMRPGGDTCECRSTP